MAVRSFARVEASSSGCVALCPSKFAASHDSHASDDDALSSCTMAQPPATSAPDVTAAPGKLLQLAISSANRSLERTLQLFSAACTRGVGSTAALAALDAAEASMSHTARLTQLATVLAAGLLARRGGNPPALQLQPAAQPAGDALVLLQQQLAGLASQCQAAMLAQAQAPEPRHDADVEEGEEATSRCSTATTTVQAGSAQWA